MRSMLCLTLLTLSIEAIASEADPSAGTRLLAGAHIEGLLGGTQFLITANGMRVPWNVNSSINATYRAQHPPRYPGEAIREHHEGTAVVLVALDEKGQVTDATIEASSGFPELDASAIEAARGWKYSPAYAAGVPKKSVSRVPVMFSLGGF